MTDNEIMKDWKKSSIVIGSPTNILAALTSFIPVIWLCITYNCWPPISTVLTAWGMVAASFGAFYFVEPVSYYAALGMTGTYLSFLSGNIGNMRVPCAALALDVTHSTHHHQPDRHHFRCYRGRRGSVRASGVYRGWPYEVCQFRYFWSHLRKFCS